MMKAVYDLHQNVSIAVHIRETGIAVCNSLYMDGHACM